ncbi:integrase [Pseudofulvimonas gallinarii]|nr:integrase [Pseudofulvimonas gallinarii]
MLHDSRGMPLFYPTLFATAQLRNAGAAVNTIRNKLADIVVLLRWERLRSRDLIAEFRAGRFLTVADIVSLRDFAKLDMRAQSDSEDGDADSGGRVVDFLEAKVAPAALEPVIGGQQHFNRLSTIADYLEFVASVVTQHRRSAQIAQDVAGMAKAIRKHRPRGLKRQAGDDADLRSPQSDLVDRFMAVGSVDDPRNPFKNPDVRLRNAILFGLLRFTGMRIGEVLSLRLDQIDLGDEPKVWVRRNQDDEGDSRRYQPVAKTKERLLPIPQTLAIQMDHYVMRIRAKIGQARRHPYLLVTHHKGSALGQPLSISAVSARIFGAMRKVDSAFAGVHPHAFRHHFNYELSVNIDRHNARVRGVGDMTHASLVSESKELDIRAFLNGQRSKTSGAVYNRRHTREASERAAREVQLGIHSCAPVMTCKDTDESS